MSKNIILTMLATAMFAFVNPSEAQELRKVPRIGFLSGASLSPHLRIEAFRQGLRELVYEEGTAMSLSGDLQGEN
jgi:hypothetical protein